MAATVELKPVPPHELAALFEQLSSNNPTNRCKVMAELDTLLKGGRVPWASWPSAKAVLEAVCANDVDPTVKAAASHVLQAHSARMDKALVKPLADADLAQKEADAKQTVEQHRADAGKPVPPHELTALLEHISSADPAVRLRVVRDLDALFKAGRIAWAQWPSTKAVLETVSTNDTDAGVKAAAQQVLDAHSAAMDKTLEKPMAEAAVISAEKEAEQHAAKMKEDAEMAAMRQKEEDDLKAATATAAAASHGTVAPIGGAAAASRRNSAAGEPPAADKQKPIPPHELTALFEQLRSQDASVRYKVMTDMELLLKDKRVPWAAWPSSKAVLQAVSTNDADAGVKSAAAHVLQSHATAMDKQLRQRRQRPTAQLRWLPGERRGRGGTRN